MGIRAYVENGIGIAVSVRCPWGNILDDQNPAGNRPWAKHFLEAWWQAHPQANRKLGAYRKFLPKLACTLMLACLALAPRDVCAGVILTNGTPDSSNGNNMWQAIAAEDFTFGSTTLITDVHFQAEIDPGGVYAGSIAWFIYGDNGGSPGATLSNGVATPPLISLGPAASPFTASTVYELDFFINPFTATGGTKYWLGLHNGDVSDSTGTKFFWILATGGSGSTGHQQLLSGGAWIDNGHEHYFQLTNDAATPEPSSMVLVSFGLAGSLWLARRRRKQYGQSRASVEKP
jgi:PEP-CTERM motif